MSEMPTVCLIGHTEHSLKMRSSALSLPFGDINNAKKLHHLLTQHNIPVTPVLDIYELFGIDDPESDAAKLFTEMQQANIQIGAAGIDFITDYHNQLTRTFIANLEKQLKPYPQCVLFLLSGMGKSLSVLSTGVQKRWPVIGKEDSYIEAELLSEPFPVAAFAKEISLMTSESLFGAKNLAFSGIPLDTFMYLPKPDREDLVRCLEELITDPEKRAKLGAAARSHAEHRFGAHQILKRIPVMARAAWSFFHADSDAILYKKRLIAQLREDESDYHLIGKL